MYLVNSSELGNFRVGNRCQPTGSAWVDTWFEGDANFFYAPSGDNLFFPLPKQPSLVIESTLAFPDNVLFAYFGRLSDLIDDELIVELFKDSNTSNGFGARWLSNEVGQNSKSFSNFSKKFWGVARITISILDSLKNPIHEASQRFFTRVIEVGLDPWRNQINQDVFQRLISLGEKSKVTSPLSSIGYLVEMLSQTHQRAGLSASLEQYFLLNAFIDNYVAHFRAICQRPASKLEKRLQFYDSGNDSTSQLNFQGNTTEILSVESTINHSGRVIPNSFWTINSFESYDIVENRFVLHSSEILIKILAEVAASIDDYVSTKLQVRVEFTRMRSTPDSGKHKDNLDKDINLHSDARDRLRRFKTLIEGIARTFRVNFEITSGFVPIHDSETLYYDGRYSQFRALHFALMRAFSINILSQHQTPYQVSSFNEIYQHWILLCVLSALIDPYIGFQIICLSATLPVVFDTRCPKANRS
jgi:hypothetical protein